MHRAWSRRKFIRRSIASLGAVAAVGPGPQSISRGQTPPNERLQLAAVGTANRGAANIAACATEDIVALCDVDATFLGMAAARYPSARRYRDFRIMLEKEADKIDAVLIGTPDHTHAVVAAMAMRLKKHVYCEKPLTHTVQEARTLARLAEQNGLVTQMGTQIHAGENYRRVVELIRSGMIGAVKEVHVWAAAGYGGGAFTTHTQPPPDLDWDLWLGPAPRRPYSEGVHPVRWRWFWDYGNGALGDFGCHYIDLVHWALQLRHPVRISAAGPELDPDGTPPWATVAYEYPPRGSLPAVTVRWYDGGKKPRILSRILSEANQDPLPFDWPSGHLFVGEHAMILSDYDRHEVLVDEKKANIRRPDPSIPSSVGHHREWLDAIKEGAPTTCNFDDAGALTESVLLGIVALRAGKTIEWDAQRMGIPNAPDAEPWLRTEYRQGWTL